ncbi:ThiF family adenylyltransferase [Ralstonia holmesii]|uniref:ThiF family adenylyltransferase n=1 Tax=Ralstonia holmesii TaxID=3058602 RepID=UPI003F1898EC
MSGGNLKLSEAVQDAVRQLRRHPSVSNVTVKEQEGGGAIVTADFDTNLASTWRANGESPTGVRPTETVEYEFPPDYPRCAPVPTLRQDFNRSLPHINPHQQGERVPPCVIYGSALEVLHNEGVYRLYDQMAVWLENAAEGKLIDKGPGWEPMRRDDCVDRLQVDVDDLTEDASFGNAKIYRVDAFWMDNAPDTIGLNKRNGATPITASELSKVMKFRTYQDFHLADSLFAVCWPESDGAEGPPVIDAYQPDSVRCYADLELLAKKVGCKQALARFALNLNTVSRSVASRLPVPIYIALAVRRPTHLIGLETDYELLAYRVNICPQKGPVLMEQTPASAVLFATPLSPSLLRQASGIGSKESQIKLGLVGCGSLGSKVATHVARAGYAPSVLVDDDKFHVHNGARHALFPPQFGFGSNKATQLATVLAEFSDGRKPKVFAGNITRLPFNEQKFTGFFSGESSVLLNTTGAHSVRHFLADAPIRARVMEACLLNLGGAAVVTLEGAGRNPTTTDLMTHAFEQLRADGLLQPPVTGQEGVVGVGVGCSSITLPMTDANISLVAAGVGQNALRLFQDGLTESGKASIAQVSTDRMSINWRHSNLGKTHVARVPDGAGWVVRVLDSAHRKMSADVAIHPKVETGGVVVGRISPMQREIVIVNVLEAPPDSKRSAMAFILGVEGLSERIEAYNESGQGVLWCLGTWHSHLMPVGPSPTDIATADSLKGSIAGVVVLLIHRPDGYSAVVRDGF